MTKRKKSRRRRTRTSLAFGVLVLVLAALGYANYFVANLPDVARLATENPAETALMRARGGEREQRWVPLEEVSPLLVRAVLMGEDAGFYGHNGFDTHEIREAFKRNWEEGRTVRGASTITQQLAKNLYLSERRTYLRKLEEAILTYRMEKALSKNRILEIYLNVIEWGNGIYGVEAASRDLYGVSASRLGAEQAATLAAMIPNPIQLHPCASPTSLRTRRDRILRWMHGAGDLDETEFQRALKTTPVLGSCLKG